MPTKFYFHSKTPYLLHGVIKAVVIPAVDLPHDEIDFHVFHIAIVIVSERDSKHNNNRLEQKRGLRAAALQRDGLL